MTDSPDLAEPRAVKRAEDTGYHTPEVGVRDGYEHILNVLVTFRGGSRVSRDRAAWAVGRAARRAAKANGLRIDIAGEEETDRV